MQDTQYMQSTGCSLPAHPGFLISATLEEVTGTCKTRVRDKRFIVKRAPLTSGSWETLCALLCGAVAQYEYHALVMWLHALYPHQMDRVAALTVRLVLCLRRRDWNTEQGGCIAVSSSYCALAEAMLFLTRKSEKCKPRSRQHLR